MLKKLSSAAVFATVFSIALPALATNVASGNVTFLEVDGTCAYFELGQVATVYAVSTGRADYQQFFGMLLAAYMSGQTLTILATNGTCNGSASPSAIYVGIYN